MCTPCSSLSQQVAAPDCVTPGTATCVAEGVGLLDRGEMLFVARSEAWHGELEVCVCVCVCVCVNVCVYTHIMFTCL